MYGDSRDGPDIPSGPDGRGSPAGGTGCLGLVVAAMVAPIILWTLFFGGLMSITTLPFLLMAWVMERPWVNAPVLVIATVAGHFGAAKGFAAVVKKMMQREADIDAHELESTGSRAEPETSLCFRVFDETAVDLTDRPEEFAIRELLENKTSTLFNYGVYVALLAAFATSLIFGLSEPLRIDDIEGDLQQKFFLMAYPFSIAMLLAVFNAKWIGEISMVNGLLLGIVGNAYMFFLMAVSTPEGGEIGVAVWQGYTIAGVYIAVMSGFGVFARWKARRLKASAGISAIRLLVLRVFGVSGNVQALFRAISRRWLNIGPMLTIVDASSSVFDFRRYQSRLLTVSFAMPALATLLFGLVTQLELLFGVLILAAGLYLVLLIVFFAYRVQRLRIDYARSNKAIRHRIADQQGRGVSRRYRQGRMYCYANTWHETLAEMVEWTNMVLMDLRGIGEKNQGCAYEISYLFDNFDLSRVVFLIDERSDIEFVQSLMSGIWASGRTDTSPNIGQGDPTVIFYRARHTKNLKPDMLSLVSLFAEIVALDSGESRQPFDAESEVISRADMYVWLGWALLPVGIAIDLPAGGSDAFVSPGLAVIWLGGIWVVFARRVRALLVTRGSTKEFFLSRAWNLWFALLAGGWLYWVILLRLQ